MKRVIWKNCSSGLLKNGAPGTGAIGARNSRISLCQHSVYCQDLEHTLSHTFERKLPQIVNFVLNAVINNELRRNLLLWFAQTSKDAVTSFEILENHVFNETACFSLVCCMITHTSISPFEGFRKECQSKPVNLFEVAHSLLRFAYCLYFMR